MISALDVVEGFFGGTPTEQEIRALSRSQVEELGYLAQESASSSLLEPVPAETYYPGGFLAGHWQFADIHEHLHLSLLYYPRLLVHDPLADFFFDDFDRHPKLRSL